MTGQAGQELLRLEGIGVRLGGRQIVRDVSFAVRAGEFTGLIGPNGAGKTTLLKVILGLRAPTPGRVLLGGRPRQRRGGGRLIGYVPQKLAIDPDMPCAPATWSRSASTGTGWASPCRRRPGRAWSPRRCGWWVPRLTPMPGSGSCPAGSSSG
jgi:ABC-type Mn2+/Zn2+ transport system ATPase subunit